MTFNTYIPARLHGIVDHIWEQEISAPGRYTVLPSGKVELIFPIHPIQHLDAVRIAATDNPVNNHTCFLSGLHTKPLRMTFERFHAFGIQMKPVAVKALFGIPLYEIRNYFVEGQIIFHTIPQMEDQLHSLSNFTDRARWFEQYLVKQIRESPALHTAIKLDNAIRGHLNRWQPGDPATIEHLLGYSRTQTFRLFNEWFGASAHSYHRLMQFIRSVDTLHDTQLKLLDAGLSCGYYDQAHFIHSFQEFADMTPGEYRRRMTSFPGQIF